MQIKTRAALPICVSPFGRRRSHGLASCVLELPIGNDFFFASQLPQHFPCSTSRIGNARDNCNLSQSAVGHLNQYRGQCCYPVANLHYVRLSATTEDGSCRKDISVGKPAQLQTNRSDHSGE